jgi:hypothetical protein
LENADQKDPTNAYPMKMPEVKLKEFKKSPEGVNVYRCIPSGLK